jgi:hypothetical protein
MFEFEGELQIKDIFTFIIIIGLIRVKFFSIRFNGREIKR